jgi:hypothetical protein
MREQELIDQFRSAFSRFLSEVGGSIRRTVSLPRRGGGVPDMVLETEVKGKRKTLIIEFKAVGQPRYLRQAIMQLKDYAVPAANSYPLIVAPYIVDQSARMMEENGVGYFDLAGNSLLDFDGIYIRSLGNPNPNPGTRQLKSLFKARSSRIVRVMLLGMARSNAQDPSNPWTTQWTLQELARKAEVSLGLAFAVKQKLLDFEFAEQRQSRLVLAKPGELLDEWARNYSPQKNRAVGLYAMFHSLVELEEAFAGSFGPNRYAFTSFSGARRIAPFVRYPVVTTYFRGPIADVKNRLKAKEVPTGANLTVLDPYDEGVFYGSRVIRGAPVVCAVQLYLDLIADKGRGEEAAQAVREQELRF